MIDKIITLQTPHREDWMHEINKTTPRAGHEAENEVLIHQPTSILHKNLLKQLARQLAGSAEIDRSSSFGRHAIPNCWSADWHKVSLRWDGLFNPNKLSLTVHCWWIYTASTVMACSRTQLSTSQSPHCCWNLKQISCRTGGRVFLPCQIG